MGLDGTLRWVQLLVLTDVSSIASTDDGGVVVLGNEANDSGSTIGFYFAKWNGNQSSAWSLRVLNNWVQWLSVAVGSGGFALAGNIDSATDFDPGPGTDVVNGRVTFLSRYAF